VQVAPQKKEEPKPKKDEKKPEVVKGKKQEADKKSTNK